MDAEGRERERERQTDRHTKTETETQRAIRTTTCVKFSHLTRCNFLVIKITTIKPHLSNPVAICVNQRLHACLGS